MKTAEFEPHQLRVIEERKELDLKIEKLQSFFNTVIFKGLDQLDKSLLIEQEIAMISYSDILKQRINRF